MTLSLRVPTIPMARERTDPAIGDHGLSSSSEARAGERPPAPDKKRRRRRVITYPPDAVLTPELLAEALHVAPKTIERSDLPFVYVGRQRRYVWGQIVDTLRRRAAQ